MANAAIKFKLALEGQLFDPSWTEHPADDQEWAISSVYNEIDEARYYYHSGVTDGKEGYASRETLVPENYRKDYARGWEDGQHFYKFLFYF